MMRTWTPRSLCCRRAFRARPPSHALEPRKASSHLHEARHARAVSAEDASCLARPSPPSSLDPARLRRRAASSTSAASSGGAGRLLVMDVPMGLARRAWAVGIVALSLAATASACTWPSQGIRVSGRYNFYCQGFPQSAAQFKGSFRSVNNDQFTVNIGARSPPRRSPRGIARAGATLEPPSLPAARRRKGAGA
eukprot:scaffold1326_cov296-Prasinococcus_capsulatus_cf.AAC.3